MIVLFVGSNPSDGGGLAFERDITALQKRVVNSTGLDISFIFLPSCPLEDLPQHLSEIRPAVVHFAAHGENETLALSDQKGDRRNVTATMIRAFVDPEQPPSLVYLSACDSAPIARKLAEQGLNAIGTTQAITNAAARAATVCFYDRLARGFSLAQAHESARAMLSAMNSKPVTAELCLVRGTSADLPMVRVPRIVAEPARQPKRLADGSADVVLRIGVMDYPKDTSRVSFFTPDRSFDEDGIDASYTDDWNGDVCWSEDWQINGDFLVVVSGASRSHKTFCEAVIATDALRNCLYYKPIQRRSTNAWVVEAIELLVGKPVPPNVEISRGKRRPVVSRTGAAASGRERLPAARKRSATKRLKKSKK